MTNEARIKIIDEAIKRRKAIMDTKGNDYAGDSDVNMNFKRNAKLLGMRTQQIWAVYFMKHIDAIMTYVGDGKIESEPIIGRLDDARNYLDILECLMREGEK